MAPTRAAKVKDNRVAPPPASAAGSIVTKVKIAELSAIAGAAAD
jgi:hypothetical protein